MSGCHHIPMFISTGYATIYTSKRITFKPFCTSQCRRCARLIERNPKQKGSLRRGWRLRK